MVVTPDDTKETFRQNRTAVSHAEGAAKPENIEVVFIENDYDPDPTDDHYEGTMIYLIRENGRLRVETDHHRLGLFSLAVWGETLRDAGFTVHQTEYREGERVFVTFASVKPRRGEARQDSG